MRVALALELCFLVLTFTLKPGGLLLTFSK
jgi:hypothetical protein